MARRKAGFRAAVEVVKGKANIPMGSRRQVGDAMGRMAETIIREHAMNQKFATNGQYLSGLPDATEPSSPIAPRGDLGSAFIYNRDYARKNGYARGNVDFGANRGSSMLGAMRGTHRISDDSITALVKFDTQRAARLFRYHQLEGAGTNRIRRVFVYFTPREQKRIIEAGLAAAGLLSS